MTTLADWALVVGGILVLMLVIGTGVALLLDVGGGIDPDQEGGNDG